MKIRTLKRPTSGTQMMVAHARLGEDQEKLGRWEFDVSERTHSTAQESVAQASDLKSRLAAQRASQDRQSRPTPVDVNPFDRVTRATARLKLATEAARIANRNRRITTDAQEIQELRNRIEHARVVALRIRLGIST